MICPFCGKEAVFMTTKQFYGRDYGGNIYSCKPCDAYVGTHGRSKKSLGTMANAELRSYRMLAHASFDLLWKNGEMHRKSAYSWMQEQMDLTPKEAHIAMFDIEKCKVLIQRLERRRLDHDNSANSNRS